MTHRSRALLLGLLALPLWLAGLGPALAHTTLTSSSPADGATVTDPLSTVVLTFGGSVRGPEMTVTGPDGVPVGGAATADGSAVTVPVAPLAAGAYTVTWAVTSGDGHELDGTLTFDHAGPVPTTAPAPTTATTTEAAPSPTSSAPTVSAEPSEAAASEEQDGTGSGVAVGVAEAVVLLAAGGTVVARRRRT